MASPSRGIQGHLHIECRVDSTGRTYLARQSFRAPIHLSKPYWDGNHLIINLVNPTAGLFAGDHIEMNVRVCTGARVVLTAPSAVRVFPARQSGDRASVVQAFLVESGGRLDVFPEIFIPHAGARYVQATRIDVESGGELFLVEMIAPGRTASGESFAYDQLEFGMDLSCAGKLEVREYYRLAPRNETVQAIVSDFPTAYFASAFIVSRGGADESFQRAIGALSTSRVSAGVTHPTENVYAIKLIAADSMALRHAVSAIRALGYSHLGWPQPLLRKL
ncbi:MAG: urease accessory protein UreD [Terrimicrobiaceae bacterium]